MNEPITVKCPACAHEFSLNEGVLSGVREELSRELQGDLSQREKALQAQQQCIQQAQVALKRQKAQMEQQVETLVEEKVAQQVTAIRAKAEEKAVRKAAEEQALALADLRLECDEKAAALQKARQEQLQLLEEKRKLQEAQENLELETRQKFDAEREKLRETLQKQADEAHRLKLAEKDKLISELQVSLNEAQRKAEQGSQQIQGEVLEIDFEQQLRQAFPLDRIAPVSTGARGADITQEVISRTGRSCGTLLFETKRTKAWQDAWVQKLHSDLRSARADIGIIVTETLPRDIDTFGQKDGIWVADFASAVPLTHALRALLHEVMLARGHRDGAKEKMELLYEYLTGNEFRQRVQLVIKAFQTMRIDLEKERAYFTKSLNKREKHLNLALETMSGMVGDVQALSGGAVQAVPALEGEEWDVDEVETEEAAPLL